MTSPSRYALPCGHEPEPEPLYTGVDRLHGVEGRFAVVRCSTCGLAGTLPRLSVEELERYYPASYYAYQPFREPGSDVPRIPLNHRLGILLERAQVWATMHLGPFRPLARARPGRLLDVGSGRGDLGAWFIRRGWAVAGIEPNAQACEHARRLGLEMHLGTLETAPWPPGSFDAVVFNHSLEHVGDPEGALRRTRELLVPTGQLVVSVPNFGCWQRRVFGSRWFPLELPRHLQHFDRESLAAMATRSGLTPVTLRTSSTIVGLSSSLQYAIAGRMRLGETTSRRLAWLTLPLVGLNDLVSEGDCLHLHARRA